MLVLGGARSGKSRFALEVARESPLPRCFVATARPLDDEMKERIHHHREERGDDWTTIEEPVAIGQVIREASSGVVLVDCLTLWLSNVMGDSPESSVESWIDEFLESVAARRATVILVSNEVGFGIVPENRLARMFRDVAGRLNQRVATVADEVHLLVAGQPLRIK